jgi:DNA-binding NtrC family response regulator
MSDIDTEIKGRVEAFVSELSELVRKAALEAVTSALGGAGISLPSGKPAAPAKKGGRSKAEPAPAARAESSRKAGKAASPKAAPAKRKPGAKRSPEEISRTTEQLFDYIQGHPGERIEEIAKALNTSTKELTLPIKKLLSDKKISSRGTRRATKYFPR